METNLIIRTYRHFPKGQVLRYVWLKATLHRCNSISLLHSRECQIYRNYLMHVSICSYCAWVYLILLYTTTIFYSFEYDRSSKKKEIMKNMAH